MAVKMMMVALGVAVLAAMSGCQPSNQEMQNQMMEMVRQMADQQMALVKEFNEQCVGYGCVSLQPSPAEAQLLVDGADILGGDTDSLVLQLGVHEFTARWPDGATATRKVYVPQMKTKYELGYKLDSQSNSSGGRGSIKYSGKPEVEKTVIVLAKPAQ